MKPKLEFTPKSKKVARQTQNLEKWWSNHEEKVLDRLDYYVKCKWEVPTIQVYIHPLSRKGSKKTTTECTGEVYPDQPRKIHLHTGNRVRWTKNNLSVFLHELIHCSTHTHRDKRFRKPGLIEYWILDELATDLLAQFILKEATGAETTTRNSVEYALEDAASSMLDDKDTRDKLVKNVEAALKKYLKTERKKYYSFRKSLGRL
jgi:uncharacterized protein YjaZ